MKNKLASLLVSAALLSSTPAFAASQEEAFFQLIEGQWSGPGEVVAGKYKGTRFNCTFSGISEVSQVGMTLDGNCRVGVFSQAMKAKVLRGSGGGYYGTFNEGAKAQGMDITSGRIGTDNMVFGLNRKQLNGLMAARLSGENSMNITLSVKIYDELIPVVGVQLKRTGAAPIRDLAKN